MAQTATRPRKPIPPPPGLETWRNTVDGKLFLVQRDSTGALVDSQVAGGRVVHISTEDRRINQERAASAAQDPFQNGFLAPVTLIDGEVDNDDLLNNPNVLSEEEMIGLFDQSFEEFCRRVDEITLPVTLQRLSRLIPDTAQVRQAEYVNARLRAVAPQTFTEITGAGDGTATAPRVVSPR